MRISICDDDPLIVDKLKKYINGYFKSTHAKCPEIICFSSGDELLSKYADIDILFLDIEMPGFDGIYVGKELKQKNKNIIIFIITSYSEYLDEAMRFHVFRYLSKPLDKQRLYRNLKDALDLYNSMTYKVLIETKDDVHTLLASSIIAVEALNGKVTVHTTLRDFDSVQNMDYWREQLPNNQFFQAHRSFIVNFEYVTNFDHTLIYLANNKFRAYLTRRNYTAFKEAYLLYLESTR